MIAAMNRGVAIHTATVGHPVAFTRATHQPRAVVERSWMPGVHMTTLAKVGHLGDLELAVVRSMGFMAAVAVLAYRGVLPQVRTAFLGMARVALVVDRGLPQHLVGRRAVRVVAIRAGDLALADRMMRGLPGLGQEGPA